MLTVKKNCCSTFILQA